MNSLLEHAARVLDHQPTRSMEAGPLHRRTVRETGIEVPYPSFMEAVSQQPNHFAVIPPDPVVRAAAAWDPRHRSLYEAAMEAAGMTQPLIVLAERHVEPDDAQGIGHSACGADGAAHRDTPADVFADMHAALMHLLHAADPDDPLYEALTGALEEMHAARRLLTS